MKKWALLSCVKVALVFTAALCGLWRSEVAGGGGSHARQLICQQVGAFVSGGDNLGRTTES